MNKILSGVRKGSLSEVINGLEMVKFEEYRTFTKNFYELNSQEDLVVYYYPKNDRCDVYKQHSYIRKHKPNRYRYFLQDGHMQREPVQLVSKSHKVAKIINSRGITEIVSLSELSF